jgi:hypothetical protein
VSRGVDKIARMADNFSISSLYQIHTSEIVSVNKSATQGGQNSRVGRTILSYLLYIKFTLLLIRVSHGVDEDKWNISVVIYDTDIP